MLFNSLDFLLFLFLFYITIFFFKKYWKIVAIFFSFLFYAYWSFKLSLLMYFVIFQGYFFGKILLRSGNKIYLIISISLSILILCIFKYFNFFLEDILGLDNKIWIVNFSSKIILPLGISFYTFQVIGFVFDIYKKRIKNFSLINYLLFMTFFPQLVAGPILKYIKIVPQFMDVMIFDPKKILRGFYLIVWGYFLKICLADNASLYVDAYFSNPKFINSVTLFFSSIFFGFQIYGDFCGYSLIAIGICKTVNINISANFNRPYFTQTFKEFWKRWHISFSNFIRDYIYIPLGGNKNSLYVNTLVLLFCFFVSGLWHGASFFFILWGFMHGILVLIERFLNFRNRYIKFIYSLAVIIVIFLLWIPFRVQDLDKILIILNKLFSINIFKYNQLLNKFIFFKIALLIFITCFVDYIFNKRRLLKLEKKFNFLIILIALIFSLIVATGNFNEKSFIYFAF